MSSEAVGWTFRSSPYSGAMFALHLAVADTVNDAHNNDLWASAPFLAGKARVSERSARAGLAQMVHDGLLVRVAERPGTTTIYRFLMPDNPCTDCTPARTAPLQPTAPTPATDRATPATSDRTPALAAPELQRTTKIPRGTQGATTLVGFDAFWRVYPRQEGERDAKKAWHSAIHRANPADIIAGAQRYANDPGRDDQYTKTPFKWLEGDCWKDKPRPVGKRRANGTKRVLSWLADSEPERRELTP